MPRKYQPLEDFMRKTPKHVKNVTLGFDQIEIILRDALPNSVRTYRPWWGNEINNKNRSQAKAWMDAGFKVDKVDRNDGWVKFVRKGAMPTLYDCITRAVSNGRLKEPFSASDVKRVCHGWDYKTYSNTLSKHEQNNPGGFRKYYKRTSRGKYKLI